MYRFLLIIIFLSSFFSFSQSEDLLKDFMKGQFDGFKEKSYWGNDKLSVKIESYKVDMKEITTSYLNNLIYNEDRYNLLQSYVAPLNFNDVDNRPEFLIGYFKKGNSVIMKLPILVDYGYSAYVFDIIVKSLNPNDNPNDKKFLLSDNNYIEQNAVMMGTVSVYFKENIIEPEKPKNEFSEILKEISKETHRDVVPPDILGPLISDLNPTLDLDFEMWQVSKILEEESKIIEEMNSLGNSDEDFLKYERLKKSREEIYRKCIKILLPYVNKTKNKEGMKTLLNFYNYLKDYEGYNEVKKMYDLNFPND